MPKLSTWKHTVIISVVTAMALAVGLLTGCAQSGQGQQSASQQDSSSQSESSADQAAQVTVSMQLPQALELPLAEAQGAYRQSHPNVSFSNTTFKTEDEADEIQDNASADIVATDGKTEMDKIEQAGLIDSNTRFDLAADNLVVVVASDNDKVKSLSLNEIATGSYSFAVADGTSATGALTDQALQSVGCYIPLESREPAADATASDESSTTARSSSSAGAQAEGSVGFAGTPVADSVEVEESAEAVCQAVASGTVDAGIVRSTDIYSAGGVKAVGTVPASAYTRIVYPVAVGASAANASDAQAFLDWCATDPDAQEIWQKWGLSSAL